MNAGALADGTARKHFMVEFSWFTQIPWSILLAIANVANKKPNIDLKTVPLIRIESEQNVCRYKESEAVRPLRAPHLDEEEFLPHIVMLSH